MNLIYLAEDGEKWSDAVKAGTNIIIIIIIIIWHYNPLCVFAFSAKSLPVLLVFNFQLF